MAVTSESQASGPLVGELETLFGESGYKPQYRDKAIRNLELGLTGGLQAALGGFPSALRQFRQAQGKFNPILRQATDASTRALQNILTRDSTPMSDLTGLGDYLFSRAQQVPDRVIDYFGNLGQVSNLARGLSPGMGGSTYETVTRGGLAQRAALDANRQALASLGSLFPAQQSALLARDAALQNVLPAIRGGYEALANRVLNPFAARLAGLGNLQQLAMGQNQLNQGNLMGYEPRSNIFNKLAGAGRATTANINQALDWAGQIYGMVGGMGGMGGMGGGGGMGGLGSLFGGMGGGTEGGGIPGSTPAQFSSIPSYGSYGSYGAPAYNPYAFNPYTGL